jgi:hypothetical protein
MDVLDVGRDAQDHRFRGDPLGVVGVAAVLVRQPIDVVTRLGSPHLLDDSAVHLGSSRFQIVTVTRGSRSIASNFARWTSVLSRT